MGKCNENCDENCEICVGKNSKSCIRCKDGYITYFDKCVVECPALFYKSLNKAT